MFIYTVKDIIGAVFLGIGVVFLCIIFIFRVCESIRQSIKQSRCEHKRYYKIYYGNEAGYANCSKCRKNLGRIEMVREKNPNGEDT